MTIGAVLDELADQTKYPNVPSLLVKNLRHSSRLGKNNRALTALSDDSAVTMAAIETMFQNAAAATGQPPEELLRKTGLSARDADPVRIDCAFAELRTLNYLAAEGFSNLELLGGTDRKRADMRGERQGITYVIEVATSIFDASKRTTSDALAAWIEGRASYGKLTQLRSTLQEFGATRCVFVAVVDTSRLVALGSPSDFAKAAEQAWRRLGSPSNTWICVMNGRITLGEGKDSTEYPRW
jgi:hypothetical protein